MCGTHTKARAIDTHQRAWVLILHFLLHPPNPCATSIHEEEQQTKNNKPRDKNIPCPKSLCAPFVNSQCVGHTTKAKAIDAHKWASCYQYTWRKTTRTNLITKIFHLQENRVVKCVELRHCISTLKATCKSSPCPHMFTATFWHLKMTLGRFKRRQDVEGMCATTLHPGMFCPWFGVQEEKKWNMCVYVRAVLVCVCVFQISSSASFLLCQSVAAMEHPGLAQPSISRLPWLSAYRQTHTTAATHELTQTSDKPQFREKPRPPATLLKGYSCCVRGHGARKIFSPKIQHRQQVVLLRHFLSFSACHTLLTAIWRT